eukprot:scaffold232453_cov31-Tisochrysis_lutea.AAC.2
MVPPERELRLAQRRVRNRRANSRQSGGGLVSTGELVREAPGATRMDVNHKQLVREVKQQVTLALHPLLVLTHRLELERQVVAEGAIEAQHRLRITAEEVTKTADHREYGVLAGLDSPAHLLGRSIKIEGRDRLARFKSFMDRGDQDLATLVERVDSEGAPGALDAQRRVDESHGPARIPGAVATGPHCEQRAWVTGSWMWWQ